MSKQKLCNRKVQMTLFSKITFTFQTCLRTQEISNRFDLINNDISLNTSRVSNTESSKHCNNCKNLNISIRPLTSPAKRRAQGAFDVIITPKSVFDLGRARANVDQSQFQR